MAAVRPHLNCLRCYGLDAQLRTCSQDTNPETQLIRNQLEEYQHAARDRALQSMDEWSFFCGYASSSYVTMEEGKTVCLRCDGSQPSLALYLKRRFPEAFLENESEPKPATYRTNGSERSKK